jgi:superfamily II RNA helicase
MTNYPKEKDELYKECFEKYPYELSIFQKYAIESIIEGHHVLVTAHTGTGKTLPAEFAIEYFVSKGKKVIYTGPIKTLMNQKFNDFTQKYPHISFGILTGDIKFNPEAEVLIMTAEILLNKLYQINSNTQSKNNIDFDIDFDKELACVVMDEVHFVNDPDRGHVWESSLMMLPSHIQLVMLSATIDQPENFAYWCENLHKDSNKQVYLTNTTHRVVPLTHYSFITATQSVFKTIKDKTIQEEIKSVINKPFVIQDSKGKFNDEHYFKMLKILKLFDNNSVRIKRAHVLNEVTKYLVENEMLPALCFVLSRKQLEICANEVATNLLEFDSKVPYIIDRECEQILRSKLTNFQEYLHLPEYVKMVSLLRKGIAIHHSGILPILREIVEILYAKGYIKLLFATETFSIGVNMPTKTVIFTDVNKFDGTTNRMLYSHEMSQMCGRAGRRGIDRVGNCFHLNNLFRNVDSVNYKLMMNGKPQTLTSKFKISYNLLLNLLDIGDNNLVQFASKSMITGDLDKQMGDLYNKMSKHQLELDNMNNSAKHLRTPVNIINEYIDLIRNVKNAVNKKRKEMERKIHSIKENYKHIDNDQISYLKISEKEKEINDLQNQYDTLNKYFSSGIEKVLYLLLEEGFIESQQLLIEDKLDESSLKLTLDGKIASQIREIHCLAFSKLYNENKLDHLSSKQLVALFSCFTNIRVTEEFKDNIPKSDDSQINDTVKEVEKLYNIYHDKEISKNINTGFDYDIHYDLLNFVEKWCDCENVEECKQLLQELGTKKEIFLGEFVKALLKINNISSEFEKIAEMTGNIAFLSKLKEIPNITLKYVVTNQSLYV